MVYPLISEDECPLWGQVLYVNAGAVDAPIAVVRSNYSEYQYANSQWNLRTFPTYTLYPHWTSRGEPDLATTNLGNVLPCTTGASAPPCAQDLGWPAGMTPYMQQQYTRLAWLGSLVENKHDSGLNGGLTYRRNRYLDGKTGRFSQLDPIGLAGGLNSYGYAAGDPVSFSDPFGLCPPEWLCKAILDLVVGHPRAAAAITTLIDREGAGFDCAWSPSCSEVPVGGSTGFLLGKIAIVAPTARGFGAASQAVEAQSAWTLGSGKSGTKWASQMTRRGWTPEQISEAIEGGQRYPATNLVNAGNGASRYVHPMTGRSVVMDDCIFNDRIALENSD